MHTLADMAKQLNRSVLYLNGLQARFKLPTDRESGYSEAYLAFLRTIVHLRALNVQEDILRDLWRMEKKLLTLLHVDSTGSPTWFLDACGRTKGRHRRLLLTNHDMGAPLRSNRAQLGLDFAERMPEFFAGSEMGEDALRILDQCLAMTARIQTVAIPEIATVRAAADWARKRFATKKQQPGDAVSDLRSRIPG